MSDERPPRAATEDRSYYGSTYYEYYNGLGPYTRERWLPFFERVADGIVADVHPTTAIEFGCAKGFLIETLRERGVDAYGIDFSPHAIAEVYASIQPFCRVGDVREPVSGRYDVAICMEVVEHLDAGDAARAVATLAAAANTVYFSSNPDEEFLEPTHVNVQGLPYWERHFERHGMARDLAFDASFIADWAAKFERKPVDIVIPVFNSPRHTRWCLESLFQQTDQRLFHLYLVDDGSDQVTAVLLRDFTERYANITLLVNEENRGFLPSANRGLGETRARFVVLLNSDTLVTPGWLERLIAAPLDDPTIGLACPLSNHAENLSVAMPAGYSYLETAGLVAARSQRRYPDAATVVGFCLLLTRDLIEKVGLFDPVFGRGYVEEADLQFRAAEAGFRAAVVDSCYVYHTREASFGDYLPHWQRNYPLFRERWGDRFDRALATFEQRDDLGYLRDAATRQLLAPPEPLLDVLFYLPPTMAGVGGMISVVEIANRLIRRGVRAGVAHTGPWAVTAECLFSPLAYDSDADFSARPPLARVIVATGYQTVEPVIAACRRFNAALAYFIQDYEGYFDNATNLSAAAATYDRIPARIAVSEWLRGLLLEQHGVDATVIPLGCATEEFYPRPVRFPQLDSARAAGRTVVFALLRADDRRGAPYLLEVARRLETTAPDVVFVFAGHNRPPARANTVDAGLLARREMSRYLAAADIVLDASLYQGFGMLGIEAMASGAATVLTSNGGSAEYARDGENALLVPPRDVRAMCDAILTLHHDPELRARLGRAARATALAFDWDGIAARHGEVYAPLVAASRLDAARLLTAARSPFATRATVPPCVPILRAFDGVDHLYMVDADEARVGGYALEGAAFALFGRAGAGLTELIRYRHTRTGDHFYTAWKEDVPRSYTPEGAIGYLAPDAMPGTIPLYQAYNRYTGDHLYTLDPLEAASSGYRLEGIVGHVLPVAARVPGAVRRCPPRGRARQAARLARRAAGVISKRDFLASSALAVAGLAGVAVARRKTHGASRMDG